jgi:N4-(beta-N-acetylglucosaminyl)-L-asparaginase
LRANAAAWPLLEKGARPIDAVEAAGKAAEDEPSHFVGLSGYPDRDGHVTLDACIMDGNGDCGAVSFIERIKHPVSVARKVMESTIHVMLSGEGAQRFALENGFSLEPDKLSPDAEKEWKKWLEKTNYKPLANSRLPRSEPVAPYVFEDGSPNHDTIGTLAIDATGRLAGMVTTSGMGFKIRGRVGDSPIIGAGLFVDNEVGAATSSGVGEEVMRICGTHTIIEQMRSGHPPGKACREAIRRVVRRDPKKAAELMVGFLAISKDGEIGACSINKGELGFQYALTNAQFPHGKLFEAESYF